MLRGDDRALLSSESSGNFQREILGDGALNKTVWNMSWAAVGRLTSAVLRVGMQVILARVLDPTAFGLMSMAIVYTSLVAIANEMGLSSALIQRRDAEDEDFSTAFWASLMLGSLLFLASYALAPLVAALFREPDLIPVLRVVALGLVIDPLGRVHAARLTRGLRFRELSIAMIVQIVSNSIVAIGLAWIGFGVWSIAYGFVVGGAAKAAILWILEPSRPSLRFEYWRLRHLLGFGGFVVVFNLLNFTGSNMDYLLTGRILGAEMLGIYTLAFTLAMIPKNYLVSIVECVAFPTFSLVQDDNKLVRRGYLKIVSHTAVITGPILLCLGLIAPEFVAVVLGAKWIPMVAPLQALCIAGLLASINSPHGAVVLAKGRPELMVALSSFRLLAMGLGVYIGAAYGIVGVAVATVVYLLAATVVSQVLTAKLIEMSIGSYLRALRTAMLVTATLGVILAAIGGIMRAHVQQPLVRLLVLVVSGAAVYIACIRVFDLALYREFVGMLLRSRTRLIRHFQPSNRLVVTKAEPAFPCQDLTSSN